jgi:hypothetical protein
MLRQTGISKSIGGTYMSTMASTHTSDMRVISTRAHGAIDYILGIVLLFSPRIFGFTDAGGASVAVPMIVGAMLILLGMITKHELGIAKIVSMRTHLMLDYGAAVFLAASPWIFGFYDNAAHDWVTHVVAGLGYLLIALMTRTTSSVEND